MLKQLLSMFFILGLVSISGCEQLSSSSKTAILDLDAIAKATGQADIIKQQIDQANNDLNSQLTAISNKLKEQLGVEKDKMGKKLSKDETKKLEQLTLLANQKMQQAKNIAAQKSQQYRVSLIQNLRQSIQPIAEEVARKMGADVVVAVNNSTIWFNPESDITDEIIAKMRAMSMTSATTSTQASTTTEQNKTQESATE